MTKSFGHRVTAKPLAGCLPWEQLGPGRPGVPPVFAKRAQDERTQHDEAVAGLAPAHAQYHSPTVDVVDAQRANFTDTQTRTIGGYQDRAILRRIHSAEQLLDLAATEHGGRTSSLFRLLKPGGDPRLL